MEWIMINVRIGKETFYDVYRRKQSEREYQHKIEEGFVLTESEAKWDHQKTLEINDQHDKETENKTVLTLLHTNTLLISFRNGDIIMHQL